MIYVFFSQNVDVMKMVQMEMDVMQMVFVLANQMLMGINVTSASPVSFNSHHVKLQKQMVSRQF